MVHFCFVTCFSLREERHVTKVEIVGRHTRVLSYDNDSILLLPSVDNGFEINGL